jgi:hypothetical protein
MIRLQELAEFMQGVAYSDDMSHGIEWILRVLHPRDNDGAVGFSGGFWHRRGEAGKKRRDVSIGFYFSEAKGISMFRLWRDGREILVPFGEKPTFDEFKARVIKEFCIDELYVSEGDRMQPGS